MFDSLPFIIAPRSTISEYDTCRIRTLSGPYPLVTSSVLLCFIGASLNHRAAYTRFVAHMLLACTREVSRLLERERCWWVVCFYTTYRVC
jgi:hypothetical protein